MVNLDNIRIVLVNPLYGGNVGSVCRAMMNMGFHRLSIVERAEELDQLELKKMSLDAITIYQRSERHGSLADAVADCGLVAGATARMGLYRQHARTPREWAPRLLKASGGEQVALVFGPEDKGLNNDDLSLCTQIIQIPSTEEYTSLNLSHAVMVCCYELYVQSGLFEGVEEKSPEATSEIRERMFEKWENTLLDIGFMKEDKAEHMMMGLRRILSRGELTDDDARIMMGIAHQAQWCARELEKRKAKTD